HCRGDKIFHQTYITFLAKNGRRERRGQPKADSARRISDLRLLMSDLKSQTTDLSFQLDDFYTFATLCALRGLRASSVSLRFNRTKISDIRFQTSDFRYQISDIRHQISDKRKRVRKLEGYGVTRLRDYESSKIQFELYVQHPMSFVINVRKKSS